MDSRQDSEINGVCPWTLKPWYGSNWHQRTLGMSEEVITGNMQTSLRERNMYVSVRDNMNNNCFYFSVVNRGVQA